MKRKRRSSDGFDARAFGAAVAEKRRAENLTMAEAAGRLKVSQATISRIEHGHTPKLAVLGALLAWLGRNINDFIEVRAK